MTERLDRIEALLENTGQKLDKTAAQQARNSDDIETLLGAIATTEASIQKTDASVRRLSVKVEGVELICDTIRAEARADRLETRQLWNDAVTQMQSDRAEFKAQATLDRQESNRRFDAQQEVIQRLLVELVEMNRDNRRLRDRVDRLEAS